MASSSTHTIDKSLSDIYASVPNDISLSIVPDETFTDAKFLSAAHYTIPALTDKQKVHHAYKLFKALKAKTCHAMIPYTVLAMAVNLPEPTQAGVTPLLLTHVPSGGDSLAAAIITNLQPVVTNTATEEVGKSKEAKEKLTADKVFGTEDSDANVAKLKEQSDAILLELGTFISAYLLRLLSKSPSNVIAAWQTMKTRFLSFFHVDVPAEVPVPGQEWLSGLKQLLNADPKIGRTWVQIVSKAEDDLDVATHGMGMMRYLAMQPLACTGMHAYKLFLEIRKKSNLDNKWLLIEMSSPLTNPGLAQISTILKDFESRIGVKKSSKFRYARLISPAFFQALQTKNCPGLVYLEVQVLKKYEAFGANANPDSIIGIETVPEHLKTKLKLVANEIFTAAPIMNVGKFSSSFKKVFVPDAKKVSTKKVDEKEVFGD